MKFLQSIRWRLQLWYGLAFAAMLCGFGFTAWELEKDSRFHRADQELRQRMAAVVASVRPSPGRGGEPGGPMELRLKPEDRGLFGRGVEGDFYYVVWLHNGPSFTQSANAPQDVPQPDPLDPVLRQRGELREAFIYPAPSDCVLVGRSMRADLAALDRLAWLLVGAGGAVLVLGLAMGWWLTSRALKPIQEISRTAAGIAEGGLSQRINLAQTETELGELAAVLNHTFARLEASFEQQARFTSDAAHELRTPLTVLITQTQSALARERTNAEYLETVRSCHRAGQRLRKLTESLLDLARLDAGHEPLYCVDFDLSNTVADCIDQVRPLAEKRGVTLRSDLPEAMCHGDCGRLAQVITNLLANAIQYNQEGGEVRASVRMGEDAVILVVADTGIGISAEDLPHVFERFYRADKARSGPQDRTGLGLAISQAIVQAHGGSIEVFSELGQGSAFTVRLPKAVQPVSSAAVPVMESPPSRQPAYSS